MHGKIILLVEDEPIIAADLQRLLLSQGCEVVRLEEGGQALPWLENACADLVLLNFQQIDATDGMRLASLISDHHLTPVLLVTGARWVEMETSPAFRLGQQVLLKPFSEHQFLARVQAVLRNKDDP